MISNITRRVDRPPNRDSSNATGAKECNIDFWSIDDFCDDAGVTPDLIKIDVEGFQSKIVPGAMKTFEKAKPLLLLEFDNPLAYNSFGVSNRKSSSPSSIWATSSSGATIVRRTAGSCR